MQRAHMGLGQLYIYIIGRERGQTSIGDIVVIHVNCHCCCVHVIGLWVVNVRTIARCRQMRARIQYKANEKQKF